MPLTTLTRIGHMSRAPHNLHTLRLHADVMVARGLVPLPKPAAAQFATLNTRVEQASLSHLVRERIQSV